jgi:predicted RNase H-like nuclease (RuvC/YqgF family)
MSAKAHKKGKKLAEHLYEVETLKNQLAAKDVEIARLKEDVSFYKADADFTADDRIVSLRAQVTALTEEIAKLRKALEDDCFNHAEEIEQLKEELAAERSENASLGLVGGGLAGALQLAVEILFDNKPGAIGPKMKRLEKEAPAAFAKYISTREGLTKI